MTTDTTSPYMTGMRAETGFELEESTPPLRISGFLCLLFGLLSFFCTLGQPLLVLPVITFVLGMIALRPSGDQKPVGVRPAMIGMVLAAGFGACGFLLPMMKTRTLGEQAKAYSRYYMEVLARGHDKVAMELRKDHVNRFSTEMSLDELYASNEQAMEALMELRSSGASETLRRLGPDAPWKLDRSVRVYYSYGREHAEVVWMDPTGETDSKIQIFLQYRIDKEGVGQWNVDVSQLYRERIVAESVL